MKFAEYVRNAKRPLVAPLSGFPGLELTGTTIAQNLRSSELQSRSLTELNNTTDFDIIFPMMDLTVETEALGGNIDWNTDEMPTIKGASIETAEDAQGIIVPEIGVGNRLNIFVETCTRLKATFPNKMVWAYALGPFSIAGRLMGMTEISIAVKLEPELVHMVLEKCQLLLTRYIDALLKTGVDGLMILEPASSLLREDDANEFSNRYIKDLVSQISAKGKIPALHNCGNIDHLIESFAATGIEALSVGSVVDIAKIYQRLPESVVLLGNLDPTQVFLKSSPEEIRIATKRLSDKMADAERFIISSGCDIAPGTTVENMIAFQEAARPVETSIH